MDRQKRDRGQEGKLESRSRILIVEEDQEFAQAILGALEAKGFEVILANTCEEGLSKLRETNPALVVIDLVMNQRGEGILFSRKVRRSPQYKPFSSIPLLMLSDLKQQADISFPTLTRHPYFLPVDEFMEKPVTPEALTGKIEELLRSVSA
jgi:DNA-binding response OmpR family regulator